MVDIDFLMEGKRPKLIPLLITFNIVVLLLFYTAPLGTSEKGRDLPTTLVAPGDVGATMSPGESVYLDVMVSNRGVAPLSGSFGAGRFKCYDRCPVLEMKGSGGGWEGSRDANLLPGSSMKLELKVFTYNTTESGHWNFTVYFKGAGDDRVTDLFRVLVKVVGEGNTPRTSESPVQNLIEPVPAQVIPALNVYWVPVITIVLFFLYHRRRKKQAAAEARTGKNKPAYSTVEDERVYKKRTGGPRNGDNGPTRGMD
jgi:hypothetical protein